MRTTHPLMIICAAVAIAVSVCSCAQPAETGATSGSSHSDSDGSAPTKASPSQTASVATTTLGSADPTFDAAIAKMNAYVDAAIAKGVDPTTIPRVETAASLAPQPVTLGTAGQAAAAIVSGTVTALHYTHGQTTADVRIDAAYKGQLEKSVTIEVETGCVLQPNQKFDGLVFACLPSSPIILPGKAAVFLLQSQAGQTKWASELGTQVFPISAGKIAAFEVDQPVERLADGLTVSAMATLLTG